MNNPLNQAHYQARRAEQLSLSGKYKEAITCHESAVGLLDQVLSEHVPHGSLESVTLQRDNHLKQQGILRLRHYQQLSRRQHAHKLAQAKFAEIELREDKAEVQHKPVVTRDQRVLKECFHETDSLLAFLENRRAGSMASVLDYESRRGHVTDYRKLPKDDKVVIEELRCQNQLLREHVMVLLKENDELKAVETERPDMAGLQSNHTSMVDSSEPDAFCDVPSGGVCVIEDENIDLPPLEPPTFTFQPQTT